MLIALIVACEIGFWVVLGAGLVTRYLLGRRQLGAVLLTLVPLIDLVLLVATVIDLSGGATAGVPARARRRLHRLLRRVRPQHDPLGRPALRAPLRGRPAAVAAAEGRPRTGALRVARVRQGADRLGRELQPAGGGDRHRRRCRPHRGAGGLDRRG